MASKVDFDVVVIGGGVNGTGIAADAAGRGLSVLLCEQNDLASSTSSKSSKLIHGGLRYLEFYEFKLVQQALKERETLLNNAPHIMHPLRFILPHQPHLRPSWLIRAGLFLYDHLAKRKMLQGSHSVKFNADSPLKSSITKGFEYSDGWVDDARLVVLNAMTATQHGASINNYTRCIAIKRCENHWLVTLKNSQGESYEVTSSALVNAAGPWVSSLFNDIAEINAPQQIRLVKGSHIIVPKLHQHPEAYILQSEDGRIIFVLPYENDFSIVGTTDVEYHGKPSDVAISDDEIDYLINSSTLYFKQQITRDDIVSTYSGVRPLMDDESVDAQKVTRDYTIEEDWRTPNAPLLSVFGGKITTYRKLSEKVVDKLTPRFASMQKQWTANAPLPGGDFDSKEVLIGQLTARYPFLPSTLVERFTKSYGTLTYSLLGDAASLEQLGQHFGHDLYETEVRYLIDNEWAKTTEDILWRRTKLGLRLTSDEIDALKVFIDSIENSNGHTFVS